MKKNTINTIYEQLLSAWNGREQDIVLMEEYRDITFADFLELICSYEARIPEDAGRIGVVMEHGIEMIAVIFAILKKGCCYVPAEGFFPAGRIQFMFFDAGVNAAFCDPAFVSKLPEDMLLIGTSPAVQTAGKKEILECKAKPDSLAYILYTSGSTGRPKGVMVTNKNVCHYARAFDAEFHVSENDLMLQNSVCSFDIFTEEVFASLLNGAPLAIASSETKNSIQSLMNFVNEKGITLLSGFPYLLMEMNELEQIPDSLRLLISGGDVLRDAYIRSLKKNSRAMIYNTYGPSETTVCSSYCRCDNIQPLPDGTYPVGKPVKDVQIEILNEAGHPCGCHEQGEICIMGNGVSNGYAGSREEENKAFVDLDNGDRLYHSGDLGYYLPDGNIAFEHRKDSQVMILGRRVEPEEVENVLCNIPGVENGFVCSYTDEMSLAYLIAYVVFEKEPIPLSVLKKEMARFLPDYMIPESFVQMSGLPLTANGKVDAAALPVVMKTGLQ